MTTREWNSQEYDRLSAPQHAWGVKVLERLRGRELPAGAPVLDAGCGTGRVTTELLSGFPGLAVVGADLSLNMLRTARQKLAPRFGERVALVSADLQRLPFVGTFGAVFSTAVFHWVKDHDGLFRSIRDSLLPRGWLIAQCGGGPNLKKQRDRAREIQRRPEYAPFFAGWAEPWEYADEPATFRRLEQAGFVCIRVWLEEAPTTLEDEETYRAFLENVTLHRILACLPATSLRETFLDEMLARADGDWSLDYWRLNIDAQKP